MFKVYFTNFDYFSHREFDTFEEACAFARSVSFECSVYDTSCSTNWGDRLVATVSTLGGLRDLRPFFLPQMGQVTSWPTPGRDRFSCRSWLPPLK